MKSGPDRNVIFTRYKTYPRCLLESIFGDNYCLKGLLAAHINVTIFNIQSKTWLGAEVPLQKKASSIHDDCYRKRVMANSMITVPPKDLMNLGSIYHASIGSLMIVYIPGRKEIIDIDAAAFQLVELWIRSRW